jgi:hypothetical protein
MRMVEESVDGGGGVAHPGRRAMNAKVCRGEIGNANEIEVQKLAHKECC